MPRILSYSRAYFNCIVKSASLVLLSSLIVACGTRSASFTLPHSQRANHDKTIGRHFAAPKAPVCAPATGSAPTTIDMTMSTTGYVFSQNCYYAPQNQAFTIDFTNDLFAVADNSPITLVLYISPSSAPVFQADTNNPGIAYGNSQNAVFASGKITAPSTVALAVPALAPGTYDIQTEIRPLSVIATLVVG